MKFPNSDDIITQTKYFTDSLLISGSLAGNIHLYKL